MKKDGKKIRIYILSNSAIVMSGLTDIVKQAHTLNGLEFIGASSDTDQAIAETRAAAQDRAPVVLLVFQSPERTLELANALSRTYRAIRVVAILAGYADREHIDRLFRAQVRAVISLTENIAYIFAAIEAAVAGEAFVGMEIAQAMVSVLSAQGTRLESIEKRLDSLSPREFQVFRMHGIGVPLRSIASQLGVSIKTAQTFSERIKKKMGFKGVAELKRAALRWDDANRGDRAAAIAAEGRLGLKARAVELKTAGRLEESATDSGIGKPS